MYGSRMSTGLAHKRSQWPACTCSFTQSKQVCLHFSSPLLSTDCGLSVPLANYKPLIKVALASRRNCYNRNIAPRVFLSNESATVSQHRWVLFFSCQMDPPTSQVRVCLLLSSNRIFMSRPESLVEHDSERLLSPTYHFSIWFYFSFIESNF